MIKTYITVTEINKENPTLYRHGLSKLLHSWLWSDYQYPIDAMAVMQDSGSLVLASGGSQTQSSLLDIVDLETGIHIEIELDSNIVG